MITKQSSNKYPALFEKASNFLSTADNPVVISSLNEYFAALKELAKEDLKYTILPLDEEPFEINANTRAINTSPSFPQNVVGVQGDEVAEIIYFKIDRYFDAMDLNTQRIYIQWENAQKETGLSREYVRDITSEPNYIIFGWPLTREITAHPGTIKYSIRFYGLDSDEKTIIYSFSTEPASLIIKPSMDFDLINTEHQILGDETIEMIKRRFELFTTDREDLTDHPVQPPIIFSTKYTMPPLDMDLTDLDLSIEDYDGKDNQYTLRALASAEGVLTYEVEVKNPGGSFVLHPQLTQNMIDEYWQTDDTQRNEQKNYYTAINDNGVQGYANYYGEFNEDNKGILEKYRCATLTEPGTYRIKATNRIGLSTAKSYTQPLAFPAPEIPLIVSEETPVILTDNAAVLSVNYIAEKPKSKQSYKWYKKIQGTDQYNILENKTSQNLELDGTNLDNEGYYKAEVVNYRNGAWSEAATAYYRVTQAPQVPVFLEPENDITAAKLNQPITIRIKDDGVPFDEIQIVWYRAKESDSVGEQCGQSIIEKGHDATASFTPKEDGWYYAEATLKLNSHNSKTIRSNRWVI